VFTIDHVVMAVPDLDSAGDRLRRDHGLASVPGGVHPNWGTGNRIVPLGQSYIELMAVVDPAVGRDTVLGRAVLGLTADGRDRWFSVCLADTDLSDTASRLGLDVDPGGRICPDGSELRWSGAGIDDEARDAWLPFFIAWDMPPELHPGRTPILHDVDVTGIAGVEVAGDEARLADWLGPAGDSVPLRVVAGRPRVRSVELSTSGGPTLRI